MKIAVIAFAIWWDIPPRIKKSTSIPLDNNLEKLFVALINKKCGPLDIKNESMCRAFIEQIDNLTDCASVEDIDALLNAVVKITNNFIQIDNETAKSILIANNLIQNIDKNKKLNKTDYSLIIAHFMTFFVYQILILMIADVLSKIT